MSVAAHPVTSVVVQQIAGNPNDQEELTTTMKRGGATTDRSATVPYAHLDRKTNDQSVIAVIQNYVTQHFFQHVKFITSNRKLAYFDAKTHPRTPVIGSWRTSTQKPILEHIAR
jgi:hypothetical protein